MSYRKSRAEDHFNYTETVRQLINDYLTKFLPDVKLKEESEVANNGSHLQKNAQNQYKIPLYRLFWFWWLLVVSLAVCPRIIGLVSIITVQFVSTVACVRFDDLSVFTDSVSDQRESQSSCVSHKRQELETTP